MLVALLQVPQGGLALSDSFEVLRHAADAARQSGDLALATVLYDKALALRPDDIDCLCDFARALSAAGQGERAAHMLNAGLRARPGELKIMVALGQTLRATNRFDLAVNLWLLCVQAMPHLALAHYELGQALLGRAEPERAADAFAKAADLSEGAERDLALKARLLALAYGGTGDPAAVLAALDGLVGSSENGRTGVAALRNLLDGVRQAGVPEGRVVIDPSIARGLDYYTGIVLESFLDDLPALGSICSGGRYDNLAGLYTKQSLPGVGASLGIDRLLAGLEELGRLDLKETSAEVFLVHFDEAHLADYIRIAARLRADGMAVEFYPEAKRVGNQLKMAAKKGFRVALVIGSDEFAAGTAQLKDLAAQTASTIDWHGDIHVLSDAIHSQLEAIKAGG